MRYFLIITVLLAVSSLASSYSKYGRKCEDIGCLDSEECVIQEDVCTLESKGHCGTFPSCKKTKKETCATHTCPSSQTCKMADGKPTCVKSANTIPNRYKRQSYNNPSAPAGDSPSPSNSQSVYPQLHDSTPNTPTQSRRITTERPNTYRIGYTQSQNSYPTQHSARGSTSAPNQGYPTQGRTNQGYPTQNYPPGYQNPGYQNPGYQNPGYQNPGYQYPGYQNPGYQNPAYQNPGYPGYQNPGYQNPVYPGYQNPMYPNPGYQNQGYQNPGYQNTGYQNPGQQNQWYPGQPHHQPGYNPHGGYGGYDNNPQKPGVLDPILNTLSKTVTQIGANYLRDKLFNTKPKQTQAQQ